MLNLHHFGHRVWRKILVAVIGGMFNFCENCYK